MMCTYRVYAGIHIKQIHNQSQVIKPELIELAPPYFGTTKNIA